MWSATTVANFSRSSLRPARFHSSMVTNTTRASVTLSTSIIQTMTETSDIYDSRITRPFTLVCLFIGNIGNSLSFIVFTQKQLRNHSTFRYLAYLSIVDLIVLYLGLGNLILRDYFRFDIRIQSLFLCKFHTFFYLCHDAIIIMDFNLRFN